MILVFIGLSMSNSAISCKFLSFGKSSISFVYPSPSKSSGLDLSSGCVVSSSVHPDSPKHSRVIIKNAIMIFFHFFLIFPSCL